MKLWLVGMKRGLVRPVIRIYSKSFAVTKAAVIDYLVKVHVWNDKGTGNIAVTKPVPMEIGFIKGAGKGKDKDKGGKHKGKQQFQPQPSSIIFQRPCLHCGQFGHPYEQCVASSSKPDDDWREQLSKT